MNGKKVTVITLISVSVIAIVSVVYFVIQDKKITRFDAIDQINGKLKIDRTFLSAGGDDYLIAWATALKNGKDKFSSAGINYETSTGNAIA